MIFPITTEEYWDCNCDKNYIHPKEVKHCKICGYDSDECPDSLISEVNHMLIIKHLITMSKEIDIKEGGKS